MQGEIDVCKNLVPEKALFNISYFKQRGCFIVHVLISSRSGLPRLLLTGSRRSARCTGSAS
jgi:hypothetical protein